MLNHLRSWLRRDAAETPKRLSDAVGSDAAALRRRIHHGDIYAGFAIDEYPLDLQGWNSDGPVFRRLLEEVRPGLIVELGTWKGGSALHMCGLADQLGLRNIALVCVDTWLGGAWHWMEQRRPEAFPSLGCRHGYPTVYRQFLANVLRTGHSDKIVPIPNTTDAAAEIFRSTGAGPIDMLYIDASHEEPAVFADLSHWWPMVRPGGIVFGDDLIADYPGVERAVRRFAEERALEVEVAREKWIIRKPADSQAAAPSQTSASSTE